MFYLGTVTGTSGCCYNQSTMPSGIGTFTIPKGVRALYLQPVASGVEWKLSIATGTTNFGGTGVHHGLGARLAGPDVLNGPYYLPIGVKDAVQVAIIHNQAGFIAVRIFAGVDP